MRPMAIAKSTGLDEEDPASMNEVFIIAPKNAAGPVRVPVSSPMPTSSSPKTISQANQTYHWFESMKLRNSRYHSYVIWACPPDGTATADVQKPWSAFPPSSHPAPLNLCQPASSQLNPTNRRIGSQR